MREKTFGSKSDMRIPGSSINDLNIDSIATYRRRLSDFNPELTFNNLNISDFCEQTGISDNGELTYGGLLTFGKRASIKSSKYVIFGSTIGKFPANHTMMPK